MPVNTAELHGHVARVVATMEKTQWIERDHLALVPDRPIMSRRDLQQIQQTPQYFYGSSSGSTGEAVTVHKSYQTFVWHVATNIRELLWRKWDPSLTVASISADPSGNMHETSIWCPNPLIFPTFGTIYHHTTDGDLQSWLQDINPHFIHTYPSIIKRIDISKLSNLIDVKTTGEQGGTCYSSGEVGTIGLTCPDNPDVYHIMENVVVEIINDRIVVTDLTNPTISRYDIGDYGQFASCSCGRKLQTIDRHIIGRVRDAVVLPNGDRYWPLYGSLEIRDVAPNILQTQLVQVSATDMVLNYESDNDLEPSVQQQIAHIIQNRIKYPFNIQFNKMVFNHSIKFREFYNAFEHNK